MLILKSGPDPRQPWTSREIDRIPTVHRIRWIDLAGDGKKVLLVAPMIGAKATPPDYADNVPVYLYRPGRVEARTVHRPAARHSAQHHAGPLAGAGRAAHDGGLSRHPRVPARRARWRSRRATRGPARNAGASEIKIGHLGKRRFIAAIEPWHGNQVVVYTEDGRDVEAPCDRGRDDQRPRACGRRPEWRRPRRNRRGFRGKGFQLYVFTADDETGERWTRHILDPGGIAAADCKIADFDGNGRPAIACSGASTANVKLYRQR